MKKKLCVKNIKEKKALTDVIGTLLLLMIAIGLFSALYFFVFSIETPEHTPSVNIIGYAEGTNVTLVHWGGAPVNLDNISIILNENDETNNFSIENEAINGNPDFWEIGETLVYPTVFSNQNFKIDIIDIISNSILMSGTIIIGEPEGWSNSCPISSNPAPSNGASGLSNSTNQLQITISDNDGNTTSGYFDISPDFELGVNLWNNLGNGTRTCNLDTPLGDGTYTWWVNFTDEYGCSRSNSYSFTVGTWVNSAPIIINPYPSNGATDVGLTPTINATVFDVDGNDTTVCFWYSTDNITWIKSGATQNSHTANTSASQTASFASNYSIKYYWKITAEDDFINTTSSVWTFTTEESPSWTVLTYDDFEPGWGNYTGGGNDCFLYTGGSEYAHQGNNAAQIQDDNNPESSFYYTNGIDIDGPGYTSIKIDFWFITDSFASDQNFHVEYYNGSDWEIIETYVYLTDFNDNNVFYNKILWINETGYTFPTDMKIRFRCNAQSNSDELYIDEILVQALS